MWEEPVGNRLEPSDRLRLLMDRRFFARALPIDRFRTRSMAVLLLVLVAVACAGPAGSGGPSPTPSGPPLSLPALKLAVLGAVGGHLSYCDPDLYPVASGTPLERARLRLPEIKKQVTTYRAILDHEGIDSSNPLTDQDLVAINDDYKQIQALQLHRVSGGFRFDILVQTNVASEGNRSVKGEVNNSGRVTIESRGAGQRLQCPICLAAGTLIDTPAGSMPVGMIGVGTSVWTTDLHGARIRGVVLEVGHMTAPPGHEVVRLTLADGRTVIASPGHPTAEGRRIGGLRRGDRLDGSTVVSAVRIPYSGSQTYDLLPSGPTGTYFANGVLLGSTLAGKGGAASSDVLSRVPLQVGVHPS
jgi:hypothetical protein